MNRVIFSILAGSLVCSTAVATASEQIKETAQPQVLSAESVDGSAVASVDDDIRFVPTTRPATPQAQHPPETDAKNVDAGRPILDWQRLTDDWFGLRPKLDDRGISFQASLTADSSNVLHGGLHEGGNAFRDLLNINITLDTEKLIDWKGGTLFANFQNQSGKNGSNDVGDLQGVSNIDADERTELSEFWYEQLLFNGSLRLKLGKVDANGDFAHTPDADEFINGSFGADPTILGFPTYPDPATSANVFLTPMQHTFVGVGVYDGSTQTDHPTGESGGVGPFNASALFLIGETGLNWTTPHGLDGRISAGVWHHTTHFNRFDGGIENGTTGEYLMLDQQLWRASPDNGDDKRGIGFFAKYGHADEEVSPIEHHASVGVAGTGLIPGREDDVLGLGANWAGLSSKAALARNSENVYEIFYRLRLTAWASIKPDLQYIHNPALGGRTDTLVGTIRMVVDF